MKTLPQISKNMGVNISTLRYRITPYQGFLVCTTTNKGKEYSSEAEEIINEINTQIVQGKGREEILKDLSLKYHNEIIEPAQQQKPSEDANEQIKTQNVEVSWSQQEQSKSRDKISKLSNMLALFLNVPDIKEYVGYALYNKARQEI